MKARVISIGTELLLGEVTDTNASYIAAQLACYGINCYKRVTVGDNANRLEFEIEVGLECSDIIITTGGLGPTDDDLSKEAACKAFGETLYLNEEIVESIRRYFAETGRVMPENNIKQALLPKNCIIMYNRQGTAPGFILEKQGKSLIMLPGPPREMKAMFLEYVEPYLKKKSGRSIYMRNLYIYGRGESEVEQLIKDYTHDNDITVATYASDGEVRLRIACENESKAEADKKIDKAVEEISSLIGREYIYGIDIGSMQNALVQELLSKNMKVATAESCTGGLIASSITQISGASAVFEYGVCTYSNEAKMKLLGVKKETLDKYTAISKEVAYEMAQGIRLLSGADIGVSTTGLAGPTSDSSGKPVGLVYIGISHSSGTTVTECNFSKGYIKQRDHIQRLSCLKAMNLAFLTAKTVNKG